MLKKDQENNIRVTVCLLTWNGEKYLPAFLNSLLEQTFKEWDLLVMDNASIDNSVALVQEYFPPAKIVRQKQNIGFAKGHNLLIKWSKSDFVLVVNQDIVLAKDYLQKLVAFMDKHPQAASVAGKLYYWDYDNHIFTDTIDSFGLRIDRRRAVSDYLQGQADEVFETQEVFGLSAACVLYRRKALESVKYKIQDDDYEYFDEDFFAYKEDVDLAWRFRLWNWENWILADTRAYHHRSLAKRQSLKERRKFHSLANKLSYRNHFYLLYKNSITKDILSDFWHIFWYEFKKFVYYLLFDRQTLQVFTDLFKMQNKMRRKRNFIMKGRQSSVESMKQWFYQ